MDQAPVSHYTQIGNYRNARRLQYVLVSLAIETGPILSLISGYIPGTRHPVSVVDVTQDVK